MRGYDSPRRAPPRLFHPASPQAIERKASKAAVWSSPDQTLQSRHMHNLSSPGVRLPNPHRAPTNSHWQGRDSIWQEKACTSEDFDLRRTNICKSNLPPQVAWWCAPLCISRINANNAAETELSQPSRCHQRSVEVRGILRSFAAALRCPTWGQGSEPH